MQDGVTTSAETISDKVYEAYLTERRELLQSRLEFSKGYDTWLLTFSGGALALSMTFLEKIAGPASPRVSWVLGVGWALLIGAVLLLMVCMGMTIKAHEAFVEVLDTEASKGGGGFWSRVRDSQEKDRSAHWVRFLNLAALILFVAGIVFVLAFAFINLERFTTHG